MAYCMKIALFGNIYQTEKNVYLKRVLDKLSALGVEICTNNEFADFMESTLNINTNGVTVCSQDSLKADLVVSMGGDGTFLNTAAWVGASGIPILGINTGRLGFLADIYPDEIDEALETVAKGQIAIEQRTVIAIEKDGNPLKGYPFALNEVAVLKHDNSSLIEIDACVNGSLLNNYMADGLILSTPTGSTGYSLSVGGPIIDPASGTFCISPVASHSLSTRPVVLCDNAVITMTVHSRSHNFLISIDGRSESFPDGTTLTMKRASYTIGVVKIKHKAYFDTLRDKMLWGADKRF